MARIDNYVQALANNIEQKLNMSDSQIRNLDDHDFKMLLKHGYFSQKKYKYAQSEPSSLQMDVLNLHYGRKITIDSKRPVLNVKHRYYNTTRRTLVRTYPKYIRTNKIGRYIDAKTGRFVSTKK